MKVILLKDVGGVGQHDTVRDVSDGYALNYLIPRGLAAQATPEKIAHFEKKKTQEASASAKKNAQLAVQLKELDGKKIVLRVRANEQGHLFKGVHKKEIAKELTNLGVTIVPDTISGLENMIKEVGEYIVHVVDAGVDATITVAVEAGNN